MSSKRRKNSESLEQATSLPTHPLRILPLGNSYFHAEGNLVRNRGLGILAELEDESMLEIFSFLSAKDCTIAETSSKAFYAFLRDETSWKDRCLDHRIPFGKFNWRTSFFTRETGRLPIVENPKITTPGIFSDTLYYAIQCQRYFLELLDRYEGFKGNVRREEISSLSREEFKNEYELRAQPLIIKGLVDEWPAAEKWKHREFFIKSCRDNKLACGPALWTIEEYYNYVDNCRSDEVPFFVFENKYFGESEMIHDFNHHGIFGESLFDLLDPPYRPDNRWLLLSNAGSFSQWHMDPNSTTAWNGVIKGRKLWLFLPPACVPCGVISSKDGSAVKQPQSLLEWFGSGLYKETRKKYGKKLFECICGEGELVVVPRGWWHCVVNLDNETVAVTQNFCAETHLHSVRRFLREKSHCVSGVENEYRPNLWKHFDMALIAKRPDLINVDAVKRQLDDAIDDPKEETECQEQPAFSFWSHLRSSSTPLTFNK